MFLFVCFYTLFQLLFFFFLHLLLTLCRASLFSGLQGRSEAERRAETEVEAELRPRRDGGNQSSKRLNAIKDDILYYSRS